MKIEKLWTQSPVSQGTDLEFLAIRGVDLLARQIWEIEMEESTFGRCNLYFSGATGSLRMSHILGS